MTFFLCQGSAVYRTKCDGNRTSPTYVQASDLPHELYTVWSQLYGPSSQRCWYVIMFSFIQPVEIVL
jgi:hypothetical protein